MDIQELLNRKGGVFPKNQLKLSDIIASVKQNTAIGDSGALTCFVGQTRNTTVDGRPAKHLEIEAFDEQANETLDTIAREIISQDGIIDVRIYHATGVFDVGDDLVYVVVAGAHREETFRALHETVERYKCEAPVWKKEYLTTGESYWTTH